MSLKRIELHNYKQHKDLSIDITGHLIAVVGRNGSGKSNLLGAIQFALTGEQPGFNKDDLLSWGENSGYVKLWFTHNGKECMIKRSVESAECCLKIGEEEFKGSKKVSEALQAVGIDKDILRQSVFVRQTEVEACLFDDARTREQNFQRLIGLGDAAKVNKLLGDIITGLGQPESMEEAVAEAAKSVEDAKAKYEVAKANLKTNQELAAKLPKVSDVRGEVESLDREADALLSKASTADAWSAASERWAKAQERLEELASEQLIPDDTDVVLFGLNNDLNLTKKLNETAKALKAAKEKMALCKFPDNLESINEKGKRCETLFAEANAIHGELTSLKKLRDSVPSGSSGKCPLCGSQTDHDVVGELDARIAALEKTREDKVREYGSLCKEQESELAEYNRAQEAATNATTEVQILDEMLKSLFKHVDGRNPKEFNESLIREKMAAATRRKEEISEENETIQKAKGEYAAEKSAFEFARTMAEKAGVLDLQMQDEWRKSAEEKRARANELREKIPQIEKLANDLIRNESEVGFIESHVNELEGILGRLADKKKESDELRKKIKTLSDVRDWFHYSNGPRVLTQNVMAVLTDQINGYLDKFGSPFTVQASSEGMGFLVRFSDGRVTSNPPPDASMLSGGQKIALAVAFRFAVYTLFSSKLGLLSLDEPTAYLDSETIARFGDLLQKISVIAKNQNLQLLMATHESSLSGLFDQTIEIGK